MKIIKVKSCKTCDLSHDSKIKMGCPMAGLLSHGLPNIIHSGCPLDDYKDCNMEIKNIILEIQEEILKHPKSPNIGKKGCIKRLEELLK